MKENLTIYRDKVIEIWKSKSNKQKTFILSMMLLFLIIVVGGSVLMARSPMVPLYNNLSMQEAGQIRAELDARGVNHEITDAGTAIRVPSDQVNNLLVELAAQGIPNTGGIDYSFFSENTSWGVTDNEFDMIRLDAMQTELSNMITGISGIDHANVMITLPQQQIFMTDQQDDASVSVVLTTAPGYQFEANQINGLYHLISKTIPNLSTDNIVIMDANLNYYDMENGSGTTSGDLYATQQQIKQDIERDIQRRVQQMLGVMIGPDKVLASVTTDIDFTQENRLEQLVEPYDEEQMAGLPISIETIQETYTGEGAPIDGVGVGEEDIPNYPAGETGVGDYELVQESVNYEYNRIQREIIESPYKIRDLGIQVAVDNRRDTLDEAGEPVFLTAAEQAEVEASIASILESIISTSIDQTYGEIDMANRTSIVFQEFSGIQGGETPGVPVIPTWVYVVGGILVVLIAGLIILLVRRRNNQTREEFDYTEETTIRQPNEIPDIEEPEDTESTIRRKQLEKMATDKPDEFAKLLRSWIAED